MRFLVLATSMVLAFCAVLFSAHAHVSERALVLILPTNIYIAFGLVAVVVTIGLTIFVPSDRFKALLNLGPDGADAVADGRGRVVTSNLSFVLLLLLTVLGLTGPRDPLENLLPLFLLTVWWICFPVVQALLGDVWFWLNPWTGPLALIPGRGKRFSLPERLGVWPAVMTYILAGSYALTDIAPDDPGRLAVVVGAYWLVTFILCLLFGEDWLRRGEGFTVFFGLIAKLSPLSRHPLGFRFPGKAILGGLDPHPSIAVFSVALLAIGSFDGLNETFWWMAQLGVNPLEFPGRSAVVWPNRTGLLGAVILLNLVFGLCVWMGLRLIGRTRRFRPIFCKLALTILPIALGYHFAHYLTSAMVNLQYFLAAVNDPLETGAALIGLQGFHVTTSFFNQWHTVQLIWLTQAMAIVLAHMLAIILSHGIALKEFGSHRMAIISQGPVALFMVLYTLFGLWLLASPVAL